MKFKSSGRKICILILSLLVIILAAGCGNDSVKDNVEQTYFVSGTVLDNQDNPINDVTLLVAGSSIDDFSIEVVDNGNWTATKLKGEVTISPVKENWGFDPAEITVTKEDHGRDNINFTGQEIIQPGPANITPVEDAVDVEPEAGVSIQFNQDVTAVDLAGITIKDSGGTVVANVSSTINDRIITISHDAFAFGETYTVLLPIDTVNNSDGVGNEEISWSFTVRDAVLSLGVNSQTPEADAVDINPGTVVSLEFDKDVTEVDLSGISIEDSGGTPVANMSVNLSGRVITINHDLFDCTETYTVTIPADTVENIDGVGNEEISWSFTTRAAVAPPVASTLTPADNSLNIEPDTGISIEFDKDVIENDLNAIIITTDSGSTVVTGVSASLNGRNITIVHDDFAYSKTYTVTIPSGVVKNNDGISNNEISWRFTVISLVSGRVTGANTGNSIEGITINFSDGSSTTTDSQGYWSKVCEVGTTVTPIGSAQYYGEVFEPASIEVNGMADDLDFAFSGYSLERIWGSNGTGNGEFDRPQGIEADNSGNIYVADTNNDRVQVFASNGVYITEWGGYGIDTDGKFYRPVGLAVNNSNNIYVADLIGDRVQKFDINDSYGFLEAWGSLNGYFSSLYDIAIDSSNNVYVTDRDSYSMPKSYNIRKYDGNSWTVFAGAGSEEGEFDYPNGIAIDGSDNIYVVDTNNNQIQKYDGNTWSIFAGDGIAGSDTGQFDYPIGIAVDDFNNIYVAEFSNHRIQKFDSTGNFITTWGTSGNGDGQFNQPCGVVVDGDGTVYVTDTSNHRVHKYVVIE